MTGKRSQGSNSQLASAGDPDSPSTLRSIEVAEPTSPDNESPAFPVYYEPQPLVAVSDHKTIEVETIKLAEDIDPRKLATELRLARPPSVAPPDSAQTEVVVVSSQPPVARRRKWRTPVALLVVFGALALLLLARASTQRSRTAAAATPTPTATAPNAAMPTEASALTPTAVLAPPSPTPTVAATAAPEPTVALKPRAGSRANPARSSVKSSPHSLDPAPSASSRLLTAPGATKPKRAIY